MKTLSIATATGLFLAFVAPASAQDADGETVNMVIVYGDDACPPSTGDEIVVCARKDEGERFRIPEALRQSDDPANSAWAERVERLETVGKFGTLSCTPTGPGGVLGCTQEMIDAAYDDKANAAGVRFGQLIEQARQERLSTIDEDAAAEQARVEQIERQYMERLERERAAELPDDETLPTPQPTPQGDE